MEIEQIQQFIDEYPGLFIALLIWITFWKGWALWQAAKLNQRNWFIAMLVVNLFGLLEIFYLFFIAPKQEKGGRVE